MEHQVPVDPQIVIGDQRGERRYEDLTIEVTRDVAYKRLMLVNVALLGRREAGNWVLVDAGISGSSGAIERAASERFQRKPAAIILTHAHFDHVGALQALLNQWDIPVFAHPLEAPFLRGEKSYPPPNTEAGGGIMPALSRFFPTRPIDIGKRLSLLPDDGTVPFLEGWRWLHTPGHTVGHVSFWRESDRFLVAGDAFITTNQESAYSIAIQEPELHGPPRYFTEDWAAAQESVKKLAQLRPAIAVTGHGRAVAGALLTDALDLLAADFVSRAVPENRRSLHA